METMLLVRLTSVQLGAIISNKNPRFKNNSIIYNPLKTISNAMRCAYL